MTEELTPHTLDMVIGENSRNAAQSQRSSIGLLWHSRFAKRITSLVARRSSDDMIMEEIKMVYIKMLEVPTLIRAGL